jgi:hypothetical protein
MAESTIRTKPVTAISATAASLSFTGTISFMVLLTALHLIKPELDPSWHFISEYAIGDYGWVMMLAFLSLAFSCVTLFLTIRSQIRSLGGYIGLALTTAERGRLDHCGHIYYRPYHGKRGCQDSQRQAP